MLSRLYICSIRWAFTRFYREFAWTYDTVAAVVSRGLWRHWIAAGVPFLQGDRVLELGSGTGYLQRELWRSSVRAIGLDASVPMLRLARRKVARDGGNAILLRGVAQHLPFSPQTFSDVIATFPAEYILDPRTIAEVWRVLKPGGQMIMIDGAQFTQQDAYTSAVETAYRITGQTRTVDPRADLLRSAGFEVHEEWAMVKASRVQVLRGVKQGLGTGDWGARRDNY
jgi:ubiquinone/menaquinone biosynthesis C-methylase UbiE